MLLVPALAMSSARLPSDASRAQQQFAQLPVCDGGGFASRSGHDDARGSVGDMEFDETRPGVEVDTAVRLHRGHERHQAAGEHALNPRVV